MQHCDGLRRIVYEREKRHQGNRCDRQRGISGCELSGAVPLQSPSAVRLSDKGASHPVNNAKMKEMYELQLQAYQNQLEILRSANEDYRTLRHDMKHHMNELKILAGQSHAGKIQEYIDSMEEFIENPDEIAA